MGFEKPDHRVRESLIDEGKSEVKELIEHHFLKEEFRQVCWEKK
jgi:hypothetical protein